MSLITRMMMLLVTAD
ncbi:hypothetical protein LINPERPRIM_LOCUS20441 [Linum perenne]